MSVVHTMPLFLTSKIQYAIHCYNRRLSVN